MILCICIYVHAAVHFKLSQVCAHHDEYRHPCTIGTVCGYGRAASVYTPRTFPHSHAPWRIRVIAAVTHLSFDALCMHSIVHVFSSCGGAQELRELHIAGLRTFVLAFLFIFVCTQRSQWETCAYELHRQWLLPMLLIIGNKTCKETSIWALRGWALRGCSVQPACRVTRVTRVA